jgi:hypothetical protein
MPLLGRYSNFVTQTGKYLDLRSEKGSKVCRKRVNITLSNCTRISDHNTEIGSGFHNEEMIMSRVRI